MLIESNNVSIHMHQKLLSILPKVATAHNATSSNGRPVIDLSVAENLLLRDEILALCKDAIANEFRPEVSLQTMQIGTLAR